MANVKNLLSRVNSLYKAHKKTVSISGIIFIVAALATIYQAFFQRTAPVIHLTAIGAGGSGGAGGVGCSGGGGGGAGGIIQNVTIPIVSGKSYQVTVGKGGTNGSVGGASSFDEVIVAEGGSGGQSGNCATTSAATTR